MDLQRKMTHTGLRGRGRSTSLGELAPHRCTLDGHHRGNLGLHRFGSSWSKSEFWLTCLAQLGSSCSSGNRECSFCSVRSRSKPTPTILGSDRSLMIKVERIGTFYCSGFSWNRNPGGLVSRKLARERMPCCKRCSIRVFSRILLGIPGLQEKLERE